MTPPIDVPRKLRQLDNDVQEIYKTLASISLTQQQHGTRLDTIETRLEGMSTKLGKMDTKLGEVDIKLDVIVDAMGLGVPGGHHATGSDQ